MAVLINDDRSSHPQCAVLFRGSCRSPPRFVAVRRTAELRLGKATLPVERFICASPELSGLDEMLARSYTVAVGKLGGAGGCLRIDQSRWLRAVRNACPVTHACGAPIACDSANSTRSSRALLL
jgi:uncharacterized protein